MDIFRIRPFHNASKEVFWSKYFLNFMLGFKSAILTIFQYNQNGTFEPVHEMLKKFLAKRLLLMSYNCKKAVCMCEITSTYWKLHMNLIIKGNFALMTAFVAFVCCYAISWFKSNYSPNFVATYLETSLMSPIYFCV